MRSESYKAWIDAMPIVDVRQKIERLERKLADLHVLERLYDDRNGGSETAPETDGGGEEAAAAGSGEGGGGWAQGEGSPEPG